MDARDAFAELAPDAELRMFFAFDSTLYPKSRNVIMLPAKPMAVKGSI
jgi:hypothetical protein